MRAISPAQDAQPAQPPSAQVSSAPDTSDPRRWLALSVISLGTLMVVLDASIINAALPQAQTEDAL